MTFPRPKDRGRGIPLQIRVVQAIALLQEGMDTTPLYHTLGGVSQLGFDCVIMERDYDV